MILKCEEDKLMKHIKELLEKQLGELEKKAVEFAIQQFEANATAAGKPDRKMTTEEALNELSMNVDFYNRNKEVLR